MDWNLFPISCVWFYLQTICFVLNWHSTKKCQELQLPKTCWRMVKNIQLVLLMETVNGSGKVQHICSAVQYIIISHVTYIHILILVRFEDNGTISLYHQSEKANISNTVLAWSCMSTINSTISRVDGRLNSAKYSNLLENHVLPLREQTSSNMIQYVHDW